MAVDYDFPQDESLLSSARKNPEAYRKLETVLCDPNMHMTHRIRALFTLKAFNTDEAVQCIGKAFVDPSALLKHELCYVLGQMQLRSAIPILEARLRDEAEDRMVRHEAAEALGAIGDPSVLPLLETYMEQETTLDPVSQTCELAAALLRHMQGAKPCGTQQYASIDPAPPLADPLPLAELEQQLLNQALPLFSRYRAMFSLRDMGSEDAVHVLAKGFADPSPLFRHEIAYVFGQLQHPASVPYLNAVLGKTTELPMVRHEAAEALGSVATDECMEMLRAFAHDTETVVRESCQVGIDLWEYERSGQLQYANAL